MILHEPSAVNLTMLAGIRNRSLNYNQIVTSHHGMQKAQAIIFSNTIGFHENTAYCLCSKHKSDVEEYPHILICEYIIIVINDTDHYLHSQITVLYHGHLRTIKSTPERIRKTFLTIKHFNVK